MIRRASAIEYRGLAEHGRNQPIKALVETDAGDLLEVYVKPSGRPELGIEGLANELFAACIAGELGLPVCEPVIVELDPDWIATIPQPGLRHVLADSSPLAFGSLSLGDAWRIWSAGDRAVGVRRQTALGIFAFDAFTANDDRRLAKPNLLVRGDEMRMIDHELCFRLRLKFFPPCAAWQLGNLGHLASAERHIFGPVLKGDRFLDIGALRARWVALSNDCLEDYGAVLPAEWAEAERPIADAIAHLKSVRDRIDECLDELRRVLA